MTSWNSVSRVDDANEHVAKFIFTTDTAVAEAVLYRYPDYATRTVICCSTQSGCPIGCRFCGAGDHFVRNLTSEEIVEQVEHLLAATEVDPAMIGKLQIMFMSMGEPLLNMDALAAAIRALHTAYPHAALLISTSAPRANTSELFAISREIHTVGLQFSVHETTDAARDKLIPFKAKLALDEIAGLGERWMAETGRKPFFNYCAHDENSSEADADRLLALFAPNVFEATVSVVCERNDGLPASNDHQRDLARDFAEKLVIRGFNVRVFDPAGQDTIGGGCGQLHFAQEWFREHEARHSVGAALPSVHTPRFQRSDVTETCENLIRAYPSVYNNRMDALASIFITGSYVWGEDGEPVIPKHVAHKDKVLDDLVAMRQAAMAKFNTEYAGRLAKSTELPTPYVVFDLNHLNSLPLARMADHWKLALEELCLALIECERISSMKNSDDYGKHMSQQLRSAKKTAEEGLRRLRDEGVASSRGSEIEALRTKALELGFTITRV